MNRFKTLVFAVALMLGGTGAASAQNIFEIFFGGVTHGSARHVCHTGCQPVRERGHYEVRETKVWVQGTWERVTVPAVYRSGYDRYGRCIQILVKPARVEKRFVPGYWKVVKERVWVEGRIIRHCRYH